MNKIILIILIILIFVDNKTYVIRSKTGTQCIMPTNARISSLSIGPEIIKVSCSTQPSMKFFLLINVKMPTSQAYQSLKKLIS